jgi:hypothetical protein
LVQSFFKKCFFKYIFSKNNYNCGFYYKFDNFDFFLYKFTKSKINNLKIIKIKKIIKKTININLLNF